VFVLEGLVFAVQIDFEELFSDGSADEEVSLVDVVEVGF